MDYVIVYFSIGVIVALYMFFGMGVRVEDLKNPTERFTPGQVKYIRVLRFVPLLSLAGYAIAKAVLGG